METYHIGKTRSVCIYILAALFLFYEMALQVSPSVMTNDLMKSFGVGAQGLGIMAAFYFYSYTIMQLPAGLLFDRYGPRKLICLASIVCALGAFFFAMTHSAVYASLGRFLMGFGSSFAFIGVLTVAARFFRPFLFAFLVGIAQFLAAFGAMGGELPLAYFVNHFGWKEVMVFLGVIGLVIGLVSFFVIRDFKSKDQQLHHHENKQPIFASIAGILKSSQNAFIAIYAFALWAPVAIFAALWGIPYLMERYGISNTRAAFACGMIWLGIAITSPFIGWLSDYLGKRKGLLVFCASLGFLSTCIFLYVPEISFTLCLLLLFLFGVASSGQILSFALVKDNNRPSDMSAAVGFNNMAVVIGGALFQPLVGILLGIFWDGKMRGSIPIYSIQNFHISLSLVPICFFIGTIAALFLIKETNCKPKFDQYSDHLM